jgi:hypothetical protein
MVGEAHALLREAKKIHRKQSSVTYHTLIHGYCKMEEFFKSVNQLTDADHFSLVTKFIEREFPNAVISFDLNLREALWVFDDQGLKLTLDHEHGAISPKASTFCRNGS